MVDYTHSVFRESASEPGEGGMIGSGIVKRKPQKLFDGDSVVNFCFQYGKRYSDDQLNQMIGRPVYNISIPADIVGYQKLLFYARSRGANISTLIVGLCMENDLLDYSGRKKWSVEKRREENNGMLLLNRDFGRCIARSIWRCHMNCKRSP